WSWSRSSRVTYSARRYCRPTLEYGSRGWTANQPRSRQHTSTPTSPSSNTSRRCRQREAAVRVPRWPGRPPWPILRRQRCSSPATTGDPYTTDSAISPWNGGRPGCARNDSSRRPPRPVAEFDTVVIRPALSSHTVELGDDTAARPALERGDRDPLRLRVRADLCGDRRLVLRRPRPAAGSGGRRARCPP